MDGAACRSHSYRQLLHELNQRCRREFDRAERLQAELDDIKASKAWRCFAWLRRLRRWFRRSSAVGDVERQAVILAGPFPRATASVSIIIPFRDRLPLLRSCLRGLSKSAYRRFEIILVDNGSSSSAMKEYLDRLRDRRRVRVLHRPGPFHFACLCNEAASQAGGGFLLFLNNDVQPPADDWLAQMLRVGQDPRVGVVGATLLYPDQTLQHAGVFPLGNGEWQHAYRGAPANAEGDFGELRQVRAVPAVTGACLLVRRSRFWELGGFDERHAITLSDVALCQRAAEHGLLTAITPHARLVHFESLSRGYTRERPRA